MPTQILFEVLHQLAIGKTPVCQEDNCYSIGQHSCGLPQYPLNRPQSNSAAGLGDNSPSNWDGSTSIHHPNPDDAETIPHQGRIEAQIQALLLPLRQSLLYE
jgi:hypothetical protein